MDYFKEFIGYKSLKEELNKIVSWIENREEIKAKGLDAPKGIIFWGAPGNGKSLLVKEFVEMFKRDDNIFIIDGNKDKSCEEITTKFKSARAQDGLSIIIIDELDMLIDQEQYVARTLLQEMDGIRENKDILVLATTNAIYLLPKALERKGRFDYLIGIRKPCYNDRLLILNYYYDKYSLNTTKINKEFVGRRTDLFTSANLRALVNETVLNYGTTPTNNDIERIINEIRNRQCLVYGNPEVNNDLRIAYHEVGHSLIAYLNQDYYHFHLASLERDSINEGICCATEKEDTKDDFDSALISIEIDIAGFLSEKYFFKKPGTGSSTDLEKAYCEAFYLVNRYGCFGINKTTIEHNSDLISSEHKKAKNEALVNKILAKAERKVIKVFKRYKAEIKVLSNKLYETSSIDENDFKKVLKK